MTDRIGGPARGGIPPPARSVEDQAVSRGRARASAESVFVFAFSCMLFTGMHALRIGKAPFSFSC
jgi:NO-binding membrane sensor protein with MHYT domain